nr:transposase [Brachyspira aalborgi]
MITYKVNKGEVLNLSEEDELFITKSIGEVILKNDIKCLAYNISRDHVHILLVCEDKELPEFIRKIKGKSSQKFKEYLNIPKEEVFHLWAQKYDAKEIDSDKRLYNTIEYINNNRIKHELPENNGLKPIILSFLCGQNAEVCNYTDEYNDTNGRNNAKAHNGLQPIANENAGIQKQGVVTPCYDNANDSKKLNEISKIESYYMDTYKTTEEHNGEKQTDNIENTYEEKAHIENARNMEIACKRQTYNIDIAHNGLQPIVVKVQDAINEAFNQYEDGGFDIVIGNPPYVDSEEMVKSNPLEREYCALNYKVTKGNWDLYCAFSEKSINLLKSDGYFGYIIPNKFLSLPYGEHLKLLFSKYYIKNIIDYSSVSVFVSNNKKINVYPIVIIINKSLPKNGIYNKMISEYDIEYKKEFYIDNTFDWSIKFNKEFELIDKVIKQSKKLNEDFILENSATVSEAYELKKYMKDNDNIENSFKFINTGTIDRYNILWGVYETQYIKDKYKYPTIKKDIIKKKFPKRYSIAIKEKIISAGMVKRLEFCYDNSANILSGKSTTVILNKEENLYNLKYIIALLNSKLYNLVFKSSNKHNAMSGGYMNVNKNSLSQFIYYSLDFNNKKDKEVHDKLVKLVDSIIAINKKLVGENNPNTKEILERQVRALDGEIDKLVYGLYGLSDNEIRIIENMD